MMMMMMMMMTTTTTVNENDDDDDDDVNLSRKALPHAALVILYQEELVPKWMPS